MEVVLISKSRGALCRVQLSWTSWAVGAFSIGSLALTIAYISFIRGADSAASLILHNPDTAQAFWQREIAHQRRQIRDFRQDAEADLGSFASRLGQLQAHVTRLDAVADRLISTADLDPEEFQLNAAIGIGGPAPEVSGPHSWASLVQNVRLLNADLERREEYLTALESLLLDRQLQETLEPRGRPTREGWLSSGFGFRTHPVSGNREFHSGVDFAGRQGLEIHAVAAGLVTWSGRRWGYGNMVELKHVDGYVTRYAHNKKNLVQVGDKVEKDQVIALLGSSGRTTGPHVHFEVVQDGRVVNPSRFFDRASLD